MNIVKGVDKHNLDAFNRALAEYTSYNKNELGSIIENRAMRFRWEIYREFRDIAPSKDDLTTEIDGLNYHVKRRKGKDGKTLSWAKEVAARKSSTKFLSVAWLLNQWKKSKNPGNKHLFQHSRNNQRIGELMAVVKPGTTHPYVKLTSFLQGALKVNRERKLVEKASLKQVADMQVYIQRKQKEAQARTIAKMNAFTKGLAA